MGIAYKIGCNNCLTEKDLYDIWNDQVKLKGTFFVIMTGPDMFCFCKEQLEKRYGIYKNYNKNVRLLAGGDPHDEFYKRLGSVTNDENIDKIIYKKIDKGFEFTNILGNKTYYCKTCKKLFTRFYLEMKKDYELYIPEYICKKCLNILEIACVTQINEDNEKENLINVEYGLTNEEIKKLRLGVGLIDDDNEDNIDYEHNIFNENNLIKIKSIKTDKYEKLICDRCGKENFNLIGHFIFD